MSTKFVKPVKNKKSYAVVLNEIDVVFIGLRLLITYKRVILFVDVSLLILQSPGTAYVSVPYTISYYNISWYCL